MRVIVTVYRSGREEATPAVLTTQHSASSYGLPVLLLAGKPYGPGDLPDAVLVVRDPVIAARAEAAGYRVGRTMRPVAGGRRDVVS